ncbi:MAG TPA: SPOR domain-containing protein [Vicinamibacterales bacterium]
MSDEGFREIQLNGKQLIFLFMAVTVVSVVIFLFGVLVGRGVREGAVTTEIAGGEVAPDSREAPAADNGPGAPPAGSTPSQAPPAPATEQLSYAERLLRDTPAEENLKSPGASETAAAPAPVVQEPVVEKAPVPPPAPAPPAKEGAPASAVPEPRTVKPTAIPAPAAAAQASDPTGPGFSVQVAAYKDRKEADGLAKALAAKGYPAFVMAPVKGAPTTLFRVRVGKYKTLKDAEAVEARLQTTEQLPNAWIAR